MNRLLTIAFCLAVNISYTQTIRYVKQDAAGSGASWEDASGSLQAMITASDAGDEVWVAKGTYLPSSEQSFNMKEGVKIYGSFAGTETALAQRVFGNTAADSSTLRGNGKSVVYNFNNGLTNAALLDGFIITGGTGTEIDGGGGIYNRGASPTIKNCILRGNTSAGFGGAMSNFTSAAPVIINCIFSGNTTQDGPGGAIYHSVNTATPMQLINCLFANNVSVAGVSASLGGGILVGSSAKITITNSVFANNTAAGGGAIQNGNSNAAALTITNTIIWGNSSGIGGNAATVTFSIVQDSDDNTNGNIAANTISSIDDIFTDAAAGDYTLADGSPAIDAGNNNAIDGYDTDLAGNARIYNDVADMGAYEKVPPPSVVIYVDDDATAGDNDGSSWANAFTNFQTAIDAANAGDTLFVAAGTYQPAANQSFSMKEGVKIYGHFAGTETSLEDRNLNSTDTSKLVGNGNNVVSNDGLTAGAVLDGFTITQGKVGMYNIYSSPIIINCIFSGNKNLDGVGGGMYNGVSFPTIINCIFSNNLGQYGGGMYNNNSSPIIINSVFYGNTAVTHGGAVFNIGSSSPVINNTIVWGNSIGIRSFLTTPTITHSLVQDMPGGSTGNIDGYADPLFVDAANGDFRLQAGSPALNTGHNDSIPGGIGSDIAGNARIQNSTVDMGAYEGAIAPPPSVHIKYVKHDAGGDNNGSSWEHAYTGFQEAIDAAAAGDTLFVAAGTYQPASGQSFSMEEGVKIFGGFAGTETVLAERNWKTNETILQGNGSRVITNDNNGLTAAAVLDGFTITGGENTNHGGGMYNNEASPTVTNCTFSDNTANSYGGGMYNFYASPAISNCIFSGNTSNGDGGGIYNASSPATITNCVFTGNTAVYYSGGVHNDYASPTITNTIIYGNTADFQGHGIFNDDNSYPTIRYSIIQDLNDDTNGNIPANTITDIDEIFTDADNGDYTLADCSPAINAGKPDTAGLHLPLKDLAGNLRIQFGTTDIGAYESIAYLATAPISEEDAVVLNMIDGDEDGPAGRFVAGSSCNGLIATVAGDGTETSISGETAVQVWIQGVQGNYVKRHYEITPANNAGTATGIITLYFTQQDFDDFNDEDANTDKLPTGPNDDAGKANLKIEKRSGTSNDGTGTPESYTNGVATIDPEDELIIWNSETSMWEVTFAVEGFSGFFVKTQDESLPLRLLSFTAKEQNCTTTLQWETADEVNVARYEVEESTDGTSFRTVILSEAKNLSNSTYNARLPVSEKQMYYRLKMVDMDGEFAYSNVAVLTTNCQLQTINIYPNPAKEFLYVSNVNTGDKYHIYNADGKTIMNGIVSKNTEEINISKLPTGLYLLNINGKAVKFIKE